ncbi:MMPL family transporter [Aliiglaciecola sp. 2_MG-2023]|uniref:efflux RND transporter permease subunit n=1 Tax=unclassified Aliiglaciecola TaxID=2593648 RepID=UPI0026E3D7F9|nr:MULTISPECIES: MMPL family transporter [unclassified Aliiglaciecola]MDO6710006.1 MMPL family transporter [Aliiglaciecola sp. 2_MG-2023]MDO6751154.1 MMPL family transporter [Aliiglaciecola sp. 1_MG-2023]
MRSLWLNIVLNRPWLTIFLSLLFIAVCGSGVSKLKFNGDYIVFFEKDNPQRIAFEEMQAIFSKNETANILIAPKQGSIFNQNSLRLVAEITEDAWQIPFSSRVDSIANFQHTWAEYDDMIVEKLILNPESIDDKLIQKVKSVVLTEPNLVNRLVDTKGKVTLVSITVNLPDGDKTKETTEIANSVIQLTEKYKTLYPNHEFYHTGIVFMNDAFKTVAQDDAATLVPLMFLVILVVLGILLRSLIGTIVTLFVVLFSILSTLGIGGWIGVELTTATVNVPTLVMTLAVADCVHVIASLLYELRQGRGKVEAIQTSMQLNVKPIFITSATTAIGFLTLNFSNVPALANLGTLTAIGVMIAFILSVTFLPSLLRVMPLKTIKEIKHKNNHFVNIGEWVIKHHRGILPTTLIILTISIFASFLNEINDTPIEYFDDNLTFKKAADYQQQTLSGITTIDFALFTNQESGINDPVKLKQIYEFSQWLKARPEVDNVSSISDVYLRLNKNMHGDKPEYYRLPENQELAAQFLLLYEMSLPFNLDLNNQLNIDKSGTRIFVTMQTLGSKEITAFEQQAYGWIEENAPDLRLTAGSQNLMFAHIGEANMNSLLRGTLLALVLISVILIYALKSWKMGAISLIPNLLPAAIGFGIWGVYSGEINMGLSVVLSMALGIIVDDTVHFLSKYQHARQQNESAENAVRYAFGSVGKALWVTTVVLTLGFAVLTLSSFALNSDMGLLTGIIIVVALIIDFLFLPAFLLMFDKQNLSEEASNEN